MKNHIHKPSKKKLNIFMSRLFLIFGWVPVSGPNEAVRRVSFFGSIFVEFEIWCKVIPILKTTSTGVYEFGEDPGSANVVKLCGNYLIASTPKKMECFKFFFFELRFNPWQKVCRLQNQMAWIEWKWCKCLVIFRFEIFKM